MMQTSAAVLCAKRLGCRCGYRKEKRGELFREGIVRITAERRRGKTFHWRRFFSGLLVHFPRASLELLSE